MQSWIRKVFTQPVTQTIRKAPRRVSMALEALEDRWCPSTFTVLNTSASASTANSLPWAVAQADATPGANTINFGVLFNTAQTITLGGSQLELSNTGGTQTITGPSAGVTISGNNSSRVFLVDASVTASFSGLTISGGNAAGGGLLNNGTATLANCTFSGDTAQGGTGEYGAAVNGNTGGTGGSGQGGAIFNNSNATLNLTNCTLSGNTARGGNGGNNYGGVGGTGGSGQGGAIFNNSNATLNLTNCTLSGNTTLAGNGGNPYRGAAGNGGSIAGGAIYTAPTSSTVKLHNSIVAGNTASSGPDVSGAFTSQGNNLIGKTDGSSGWIASGASADLTGTSAAPLNPLLAPLGNYGGPTQTMALLPGSPAIDAGASGGAIPTTDQRGKPRDGATDIGAFESQGFTFTPVAGSTPQTAAIGAAFANPLAVTVTPNNPLEPVNGGAVHFVVTPAANGAAPLCLDANSPNGLPFALFYSVTVASGQAAISAGPNNIAGSYTMLASATGSSPAVSFALTNAGPNFSSLVVNTTSAALFAGPGLLSLPLAVLLANSDGTANSITFNPTVFATPQTITLTGQQLELTDTSGLQTITGPAAGVTISGGGLSRVFQADTGVSASFSGLTITDGRANLDASLNAAGGGLLNNGTVTLTNCTFSGDTAQGGNGGNGSGAAHPGNGGNGGSGEGGAIFNNSTATLTLTNCTLSGNTAQGGAGGNGGNSSVEDGTGGNGGNGGSAAGGAIFNNSTVTLTLKNCTISGSTAQGGNGGYSGQGGFIGDFNGRPYFGPSGAPGNGGSGAGGAIFNNSTATLPLTNCTLSGNMALGGNGGSGGSGAGGAIYNNSTATLSLISCTLAGNTARAGVSFSFPGGSGRGGGIFNNSTATLVDTIVAGNAASTGRAVVGQDLVGPFTSLGNNLISRTDGSTGWVGSDLTGAVAAPLNALLAPLGSYGGPTQTIALLPGSPAIDAGASGTGIPTTDERGMNRVGVTDIGAFESQGFTLTPVAGSTPQSAQIGAAFANPLAVTVTSKDKTNPEPVNGGIVQFNVTPAANGAAAVFVDPNSPNGLSFALSFSLTVASGQVAINAAPNNAVGGYTLAVSATGALRASFQLTNTGSKFSGLVVNTASSAPFAGAGLLSLPLAVALANNDGVANNITFDSAHVFATQQTITLTGQQLELTDMAGMQTITGPAAGVIVSGNNASRVFQVDAGVTASFSALTITGGVNTGLVNLGSTTVTACTFSGNSGGGVVNSGTATLSNCTISGNSGGGMGNSGVVTLTNCTISGNSGASLNNSGTATLFNTISDSLLGALTPASSNNLTGSDLLLGPLGNYGGPTQTVPLLPGSPAIDAGSNALASAAGLTKDQRGMNRLGVTDIGAFESQGFTLTPVAGSTPQSAAIGTAFANPLALTVISNDKTNPEPVNGGIVQFNVTPAANGAAAVFVDPNSPNGLSFALSFSLTVASGQVAINAAPNDAAGSYTVAASAAGATQASFTLTNTGTASGSLVVNTTSTALFAGPGLLSLPFAITLANDAGAASTITFDPTVFATPQTIILTGRQLELSNTAGLQTITGPAAGVIISGNNASRVFQVDAGVSASFSALTIAGGNATKGGGVCNDGTLTLADSTISGNSASGSGGGGVFNDGAMILNNCTISGNTATAFQAAGGGLLNNGTMALTNCTITANSVTDYRVTGGGLNNNGGTLTLTNCTVTGNTAGATGRIINTNNFVTYGSGLFNTGAATLVNTIVAGNLASQPYPFQAGSVDIRGSLTPTSSHNLIGGNPLLAPLGSYTLTQYDATQTCPPLPGSPAIDAGISAVLTTLTASIPDAGAGTITVASTAGLGVGLYIQIDNEIMLITGVTGGTTLTVERGQLGMGATTHTTTGVNVTLAADQRGLGRFGSTDIGACESQGYVLTPVPGSTPQTSTFGVFNPLAVTVTPTYALDPVNGGIVNFTVPTSGPSVLLSSTVTITSGVASTPATVNGLVGGPYTVTASTVDSNTVSFSLTNGESGSLAVNTIVDVVNSTDSKTSLREAIAYAKFLGGNQTVTFDTTFFNSPQTILLTAGPVNLTNATGVITIQGLGVDRLSISGNNASRVFTLYGGSANLRGVTVTGGSTTANGAGLYDNGGTLTLTNCTVSGSSAANGGGLYNKAGTLNLTNCTLSGDSAASSGGALLNAGAATLINCTVSANTAGTGGGLVNAVTTTLTLGNTIVAGNAAGAGPDVAGAVTSLGNNLIGKTDGSSGWVASDQTGTVSTPLDAQLQPLDVWQTMLPLTTSPVLDKGNNSLIPAGISTDERGLQRILNGTVDIGAVEGTYNPSFLVNTTSDEFDLSNNVTSLREAIFFANAMPNRTIAFDASVAGGTISLASGQLELSDTLGATAIVGTAAGLTISGGGLSRVFQIAGGVTATFLGLTITGGAATTGGGLWNGGTLTLTDCTLSGNSVVGPSGGYGQGGAVFNNGTLNVANCTVSGNTAQGGPAKGGAIFNNGVMNLTSSTLIGNSVVGGGEGGGVFNKGSLSLTDCTVSGNAADLGGGIYNRGTASLTSCTVSSNRANSFGSFGAGGGLWNYSPVWKARGRFTYYYSSYGSASFTLANTIVAGNSSFARGADARGSFLSQGHNLIGKTDFNSGIPFFGLSTSPAGWTSSDLTNVNAQLGPLGSYGGPTQTLPLLLGSPALNAGASGPGIPTTDQRGLPRSGAPDIGAFERQANEGVTYVVNTTSDALNPGQGLMSLREAVALANSYVLPSTITFDPTLFATHQTITESDLLHLTVPPSSAGTAYFYQVVAVTANNGQVASLEVGAASNSVTLNWSAVPGAISFNIYRRASGAGYVLLTTVSGPTLTFTDTAINSTTTATFHAWLELSSTNSLETITGPAAGLTINGGGLGQVFQIDAGAHVSLSGLTISGATIAADIPVGQVTGALTINQGAALMLDQCTISGNTGTGVLDSGTVTLTNCTITGSTAQVGTGGMRVNGNTAAATLTNCTISGNTGKGTGGIVATQSGSITLVNTIVAGNTGANQDVAGTFISQGNNLIGVVGATSGWMPSDLTGTSANPLDPLLSTLGDNGGPTPTMALLSGSPAIDAGASDVNIPQTDQRGYSRVGGVDIGAFEFGGVPLAGSATILVTGYGVTYDGSAHTATGTATGTHGEDLSADLTFTATTHTSAGAYTDSWTFHDLNGIYQDASGTVTDVVGQATPTVVVSGYTRGTYDGNSHTQTVTVTGVPAEGQLYSTNLSGANAGDYSQAWSFSSNPNYAPVNGTLAFTIGQASASISVTGYSVTYNGSTYTAAGTATGAQGEGLTADIVFTGTTHTSAGNYTDTWTFHDPNGNYQDASGTVTDVIGQATPTVVVSGYTGGAYDGTAHTQTVTITGVPSDGQLYTTSLSGANAGDYSQAWSFSSNPNYAPVNGSLAFTIGQATPSVMVSGYTGGNYDGNAHTQTVTVTGVPADGQLYTTSLTGTDAGVYSQAWSFGSNPNYTTVNDALAFTIGQTGASISVTGYSVTYNGRAFTPTGTATGVKGEDLGADLTFTDTKHTSAGSYTDPWTFHDPNGNYLDASGTVTDVIGQATPTVVVSGYTGGAYDGTAHTQTVTVTGVPGDGQLYTTSLTATNASAYIQAWSFSGNPNYVLVGDSLAFTIGQATPNVVVSGYTGGTYDGTAHTQTVTVTGVPADGQLYTTGLSGTSAGNYSQAWSFGNNANYTAATGTLSFTISQASATFGVTPYSVTYDGKAHTATGTVTGVQGEDLSADLTLTGTTHTSAGSYTDTWTFHDPNGNYQDASSTVNDGIGQATPTVVVSGYTGGTYDGTAHSQTVTVTGVLADGQLLTTSLTGANAGSYSQGWSFGSNANYAPVSGTLSFTIGQAAATVSVTPYSITYDGKAHTATGTATGVGGVDLSGGLALSGTTHTSAGTYHGDFWSFAGGMNYFDANGTVNDSIAQAPSTTTVTFVAGPFVWTGAALTPAMVTVTGAGGLSLTPTASYANNVNVGLATASYSYAGDANHLPSSDSKNFTIVPALPVVIGPTATSITSNLATLGGNVTSNGGVAILKRGILYAPTSTNSSPTLHGNGVIEVDATSTATGVLTQDLTGLTPNTRYSFVAFATNVQGIGYSPTGTFSTTILGPLSVITGPGSGRPGQVLTYVLDGYDPSPGMQLNGFVFRIKWGDGKTDAVTAFNDTTLNHTYASAGTYTIQITATDGRGFILPTGTCTVVISAALTPGANLAAGGPGGKQTPAVGVSMLVAAANGSSSNNTPANTTASALLVGPGAVSSAPAKPPVASTSVTPAQSAALDAVLAEWVTNHKADSNSLDLLAVGNPGYDWSVGDGLFGG